MIYIPTADGANMAGTQAVQNLIVDTKEKYTKKNTKNTSKKKNLKAYDEKQDVEAIIDNFTDFVDEKGIHEIFSCNLR